MSKTHYEVLGITRSAPAKEIKAVWKILAKKLHPDVPGGDADKFAEVSAAYAVLRDLKSRRAYDSQLSILRKPCTSCNGTGKISKQKGFVGRVVSKCAACNGAGLV